MYHARCVRIITIIIFIAVINIITFPKGLLAQNFDIAYTYDVTDEEAINGDVMVATQDKGIVRSTAGYDSRILGVLQEGSLLVLRDTANSGQKAVARTGDTSINVTDFNGEIKPGDYVTSSPITGKGMKAVVSGYVVGIATSDFAPSGQTTEYQGKQAKLGTVNVAIRIEYAELTTARSNIKLLNDINAAFFKNLQDPEKFTNILRYVIAGFITLFGVVASFYVMSRVMLKGTEAIGRNPLARSSIQFSMAFNILLILLGLIGVVIIDFIIIRF